MHKLNRNKHKGKKIDSKTILVGGLTYHINQWKDDTDRKSVNTGNKQHIRSDGLVDIQKTFHEKQAKHTLKKKKHKELSPG